ncbi:glycosyl hydrolase-related protein [Synechococcus sp. Nb3U1]|uniref:glycoside hydrolase family 38 N-terminal domain-containing protein n=1 Tax=Synechococcus sp. Nb3U1 TaxID=1914529 RepID=UPI001F2E4BB5|nr:glycosyl hydrolase-related protein [Synechococcus sp. Nb3U1]MCF2971099.1 glycosyl hydrolase-related protein [Synechococcus sp. Nb3U1]
MRAIIISHTHWDRAWYLPFQVYRLQLVRLIDHVLDILESQPDYRCFTLDGQTVVLEDYRQIRPQRWPELEQWIRSGRLQVGPFFVLPDEFLVSGEALIRNLQRGIRLVRAWGGIPSEGYMPDSFGHIAQIPQILQGFGLRSFLFMRGMSAELFERTGTEFYWQAPDGSRVLAVNLRGGYDNFSAWGYPHRFGQFRGGVPDPHLAIQHLQECLEQLLPHSRTGVITLCNGGDHMPPQPELTELLEKAQQACPDIPLRHGSYPELIQAMLDRQPDLATYSGELLGNAHHPILSNVWSARVVLKQCNQRVQSLLERYVEPLVAALGKDGIPWVAHLEEAWRQVLLCHPHDDICGCSIDPVHQDNLFHFRQAETIARSVVAEALSQLALQAGFGPEPFTELVAVFNPHPYPITQQVECSLLWHGDPSVQGYALWDERGRQIPVGVELEATADFQARHLDFRQGSRLKIHFEMAVPATGLRFLRLGVAGSQEGSQSQEQDPETRLSQEAIENATYRITVNETGQLRLLHKPSGQVIPEFLCFEDQQDEGDLYSCSLTRSPVVFSQSTVTRLAAHHLQVVTQVQLPWDPSNPLHLVTDIHLQQEWIQFTTHFHNRLHNHRLRVLLPCPAGIPAAYVTGHFQVHARPRVNLSAQDPNCFQGYPGEGLYPTQFSQDMIYARDPSQNHGVLIAHRGLHEYELVDRGQASRCALTLLRAVGVLSRAGGAIRRVQAGPSIPTPEGQCQGEHRFEYAWRWVEGSLEPEHAAALADAWVNPLWAEHVWLGDYEQPHSPGIPVQFIQLDNPKIALSALKRDEAGRLIVRLFNRSSTLQQAQLQIHRPITAAYRCDLNEDPLPEGELPFEVKGGAEFDPWKALTTVDLHFNPAQILCLAFLENR